MSTETEEVEEMHVTGRAQLAAAIRAVPHDRKVVVILHRKNNRETRYSFDFSRGVQLEHKRRYLGSHYYRSREIHEIDKHLASIAGRVEKLPLEVF